MSHFVKINLILYNKFFINLCDSFKINNKN